MAELFGRIFVADSERKIKAQFQTDQADLDWISSAAVDVKLAVLLL